MSLPEKEMGPWPAPCPRCGEEAAIGFAETDTVEVSCPNCGRFKVVREEFDRDESEITETDRPE